jgi:uncharacterized protein (DUF983 family)
MRAFLPDCRFLAKLRQTPRHPAARTFRHLLLGGRRVQVARMTQLDTQFETMPDSVDTRSQDRDVRSAMLRGWRRKCPNCGTGPMLKSYLKVRDNCPVCDQELLHHRADDGPAYLTILIVGHIMAPMLIWVFTEFRPEPMVLATSFTVGCVALSLYLLPRLKGAIVGLQWAKRMYGFGSST